MPEGHTIHRLARDLRRDLIGRAVAATSPQGRFASGASAIDGTTLISTDAVGKHLFLRFVERTDPDGPGLRPSRSRTTGSTMASEMVLHVHLGLFGKLRRSSTPADRPREAIRLRLEGEGWTWDLSGPTACELIDDEDLGRLRDRLGPDPLRRDADAGRFVSRVTSSRKAIGALLLDQMVVAGIGNVYRSELCFRHGVDPRVAGRDLDAQLVVDLWDDAVALLAVGVRLGRIVTVDPSEPCVQPPRASVGRLGRDQRLYVYRRPTCLRCGAEVEWFDLANRRAYACPVEQPR